MHDLDNIWTRATIAGVEHFFSRSSFFFQDDRVSEPNIVCFDGGKSLMYEVFEIVRISSCRGH